MPDYKVPKIYKDRWRMYQRAIRIMAHLRGDIVLTSEMEALHALVAADKDGFGIGPDFNLIAQAAILAQNGYDIGEEEVKKVQKSITRSTELTYEELLAQSINNSRSGDVPPPPVVRDYTE